MQGFAPLFRMITDRIEAFLADRGYDADAIREEIEAAGAEAVIPAKVNRRDPVPHDRAKYKWRNLIERLFNKLKNWRRVATRYDKTKESYLGFVALASVKLWIPFVHETYSAIGSLKPGRFRRWLTIVILWVINWGARHIYRSGRLARVNTIHFASWTFLDDRRRVFFASNYDGSREAYNDDFINKVAFGLNLSFSNGLGYPRTDWLVRGGARHERDFKWYLFHHQIPTQVWYNPFRGLTTYDMARNARLRATYERRPTGAELARFVAEI